MEFKIKWDEVCWVCEGTGKKTKYVSEYLVEHFDKDGYCKYCNHIGHIMTDEGKELVEFLARNRVLG